MSLAELPRTSAEPEFPDEPSSAPRPRRWTRVLIGALVVVGVIVLFAPQIICRTPLLEKLVDWGAAQVRGRVNVGEASLGWFSAPSARSIELTDEHGQTVLRAAELRCDRSLWNLVTSPSQLGRLRIERPELQLVVRADGSTNLEEVLEKLLTTSGAPSKTELAVEIVSGAADIRDEATGRRWAMQDLNCVVILPADGSTPQALDLKGALVAPAGKQPLSVRCAWRNGAAAGQPFAPQGDAAFSIAALPLDLLQALSRGALGGMQLSGVVAGEGKAKFDLAAAAPTAAVEAHLQAYDLALGGIVPAGETIRLAHVDLPLKVSIAGERLTVEQLGVVCDVAQLDVRGTLDGFTGGAASLSIAEVLDLLSKGDAQATLKINLAKAAQTMPRLLRLRDDVQLTGGEATLNLTSARDAQGVQRWTAEMTSTGLMGLRGNTSISWPEPLQGIVEARITPAGPLVDRIICRSDFLTIEGTNSPRAFDLTAQYDLQRLFQRVSQFVDLSGMQLQGQGTAEGSWTHEAGGRFNVEGAASIADFRLSTPGMPAWTEAKLVLGLKAVGGAAGLEIQSLDEATIGVQSGDDQLTVRLSEPQPMPPTAGTWPLAIAGRGDLGTWINRLRPFVSLPNDLQAAGHGELTAAARLRLPDDVEITESKLAVRPLHVETFGLLLDEQSADLTLAGRFRATQIEVRDALLIMPSLAVQLRNVLYTTPPGRPPELTGEAGLRADVGRMQTLLLGGPMPVPLSGMLEVIGKLQQTGSVIAMSLDSTLKDLTVMLGGKPVYREPQIRLVGSGVYEPQRDSVAVDRLELTAESLQLRLNGKMQQMSTIRDTQVAGEINYDLAQLTPLIQAYVGKGVSLSGRDAQRFELSGPIGGTTGRTIDWTKLNGSIRLAWDQLMLYGLPIGKQTLEGRLSQGMLRMNPLAVPVGTGRVRVAPTVQLGPEPQMLHLEPGVLADHVGITPEMAREHMPLILPILAGVANVSGQFSAVIDELHIPIERPAEGVLSGKLTVHAVDIGPGYITQELATLLQQPLTMSLTRESTVDFKMIQGRVYHQNLEFAFPEVTVRTHGSVGVEDQTLSLVAEMPIPSKLLGATPALQSTLAGRTIRIPITGTLTKPTLDSGALRQMTADLVRDTAQGALNQGLGQSEGAVQQGLQTAEEKLRGAEEKLRGGLNRGLDRLLGPSGALNPLAPRR